MHDLFLYKIARRDNREEGEIWNLDQLLTCGIPYANTDGIPQNSAEFRAFLLQKIPRNSAEFRGIPYVFQQIPYFVGSQKRTSVDTLNLCAKTERIPRTMS